MTMGNAVTLAKNSDLPFVDFLLFRILSRHHAAAVKAVAAADNPASVTAPSVSGAAADAASPLSAVDEPFRRTALHWACLRDNGVVVKLLVGFGADATVLDAYGCAPLHYATWRGSDPDVMTYLALRGEGVRTRAGAAGLGQTPLHFAASGANLIGINFCLRMGADVNAAADNGATPLHFAAAYCRKMEVFKRLKECGANVQAKDFDGRSIAHLAAIFKNEAALEFAIGEGIKIIELDNRGKRPLDYVTNRYTCETASYPPNFSVETHLNEVKRVQDRLTLYTTIAHNLEGGSRTQLFGATTTHSLYPNSKSVFDAAAPSTSSAAPSAPILDPADLFDCIICMENKKDTAFGCGHLACGRCAARLTQCHLCKRSIVDRRRIFID